MRRSHRPDRGDASNPKHSRCSPPTGASIAKFNVTEAPAEASLDVCAPFDEQANVAVAISAEERWERPSRKGDHPPMEKGGRPWTRKHPIGPQEPSRRGPRALPP